MPRITADVAPRKSKKMPKKRHAATLPTVDLHKEIKFLFSWMFSGVIGICNLNFLRVMFPQAPDSNGRFVGFTALAKDFVAQWVWACKGSLC